MKLIIVLLLLGAYLVVAKGISNLFQRLGERKSVDPYRVKYLTKTVNLTLAVLTLMLVILSTGFEYSQVAVFVSSVFAVVGVAMFAQWSILSNITASLIIFFAFPYRVGDRIKVVDKDDDISGVIDEITLFHVIIKSGKKTITYPNSLILQKAVIKPNGEEDENYIDL